VAADGERFVAACEQALQASVAPVAQAALPSWEQGAEQVVTLLASLKLPDGA
jgi:hypothetical protein